MTHSNWDGTERRLTGERRLAQSGPWQEYPKWVDGVVYQSAEDEATRKGTHAPAPEKAGAKPKGPPPVSLPELSSPEHERIEHEKMQPTAKDAVTHAKAEHAKAVHKPDTHKKK